MKIFLDSSVIIAALLSSSGGSAQLANLSEAGIVEGYISNEVTHEVKEVLKRKLPDVLPLFAKLITISKLQVVSISSKKIEEAKKWINDPCDAHVLAAAKKAKVDYLLTLDVRDFIHDKAVAKKSGLIIMTPGDFLQTVVQQF